MNDTRLNSQIDFAREIDKEKRIERRTLISDASRFENDAEHAWHVALMAILLHEYANEPIDLLKTVTMLLIHDIVEVDAGDTYAYDEKGQEDHFEREQKAAQRIFGLLPEDQKEYFIALWKEFEERTSPKPALRAASIIFSLRCSTIRPADRCGSATRSNSRRC